MTPTALAYRLFPLCLLLIGLGWQQTRAQEADLDAFTLGTQQEIQAQLAGSWTEIPDNTTSGSPDPRHETAFVMAGGKFYLITGREATTIDIFDPQTNTWTNGPSSPIDPTPMHHFQPLVVDGLIFAVMAYTGNCCREQELGATHVYIYDPVINEWITGPAIPENRQRGSTGVVQYNDTLYILGGLQFGHGQNITVSYNRFDSYNPYTNEWAVLPDMPRNRDHFGAAIVGDKIYAAGGRDTGQNNGFQGVTTSKVDVYDISDGQWTTLSNDLPTERGGTATAVLGADVVVIGGERSDTNAAFDTVEALNTNTTQWQTGPSLNNARHGTTAAVCNGTIWIAGGSPVRGGGKMINIERYHPVSPTVCNAQEITASSLSSPFGYVGAISPGSDITESITINTMGGNQAVYVKDIRLENNASGEFSITNAPNNDIIIAPSSSITVDITYTPSGAGDDTANLVIETPQKGNNFVVTLSASTTTPDIDLDDNNLITPSDVLYVINRLQNGDRSADVTGDQLVDNQDVQAVLDRLGETFP